MASLPDWNDGQIQPVAFMRPYYLAVDERALVATVPPELEGTATCTVTRPADDIHVASVTTHSVGFLRTTSTFTVRGAWDVPPTFMVEATTGNVLIATPGSSTTNPNLIIEVHPGILAPREFTNFTVVNRGAGCFRIVCTDEGSPEAFYPPDGVPFNPGTVITIDGTWDTPPKFSIPDPPDRVLIDSEGYAKVSPGGGYIDPAPTKITVIDKPAKNCYVTYTLTDNRYRLTDISLDLPQATIYGDGTEIELDGTWDIRSPRVRWCKGSEYYGSSSSWPYIMDGGASIGWPSDTATLTSRALTVPSERGGDSIHYAGDFEVHYRTLGTTYYYCPEPSITALQKKLVALAQLYVNSNDHPSPDFTGETGIPLYTQDRFFELTSGHTEGFTRTYIPHGLYATLQLTAQSTISLDKVEIAIPAGYTVRDGSTFTVSSGWWTTAPTLSFEESTQELTITEAGSATVPAWTEPGEYPCEPITAVTINTVGLEETWTCNVTGNSADGYVLDSINADESITFNPDASVELNLNGDWSARPRVRLVDGKLIVKNKGKAATLLSPTVTVTEPAVQGVKVSASLTPGDYAITAVNLGGKVDYIKYGVGTTVSVSGEWDTEPILSWNATDQTISIDNAGSAKRPPVGARVVIKDTSVHTDYGYFQEGDLLTETLWSELKAGILLLKWTCLPMTAGATSFGAGYGSGSSLADAKADASSSYSVRSIVGPIVQSTSCSFENSAYTATICASSGKFSLTLPDNGRSVTVNMHSAATTAQYGNTAWGYPPEPLPNYEYYTSTPADPAVFDAFGLSASEGTLTAIGSPVTTTADGSTLESDELGSTSELSTWSSDPSTDPSFTSRGCVISGGTAVCEWDDSFEYTS